MPLICDDSEWTGGLDVYAGLSNSESYPQPVDGYGLPSSQRIDPQRLTLLADLYDHSIKLYSRIAIAPGLESWVLIRTSYDLGYTIVSAFLWPSLYTVPFLRKVKEIAGIPKPNLIRQGFARLPKRGLVCLTSLDGLFTPGVVTRSPTHREVSK